MPSSPPHRGPTSLMLLSIHAMAHLAHHPLLLIQKGVKLAVQDFLGPSESVTLVFPCFLVFLSIYAFFELLPLHFVGRLVIYPGQQLGSHRSERRAIIPKSTPKYHDEFRCALRLVRRLVETNYLNNLSPLFDRSKSYGSLLCLNRCSALVVCEVNGVGN